MTNPAKPTAAKSKVRKDAPAKAPTTAPDKAPDAPTAQRLAKAIAASGRASRRQAEGLINEGRVSVNGKRVDTPAFTVEPSDVITVDGEEMRQPPLRLWLYYKPAGLVTTARDEKGRKTIYEALPPALAQVNTVGRLDLNSEGLLLLTNHGGLKRTLELPKTGWRRKYRVRAFGKAGEAALERLRAGIEVDGIKYLPMEIVHERDQGDNAWYSVSLREGKNREIRRAFEAINLTVNRLIRVSYGPFQLGGMEKGEVSEMRAKALRTLLGGLIPEGVELPEAPMDLSVDEEKSTPKSGKLSKMNKGSKRTAAPKSSRNVRASEGNPNSRMKREQSPRKPRKAPTRNAPSHTGAKPTRNAPNKGRK